MSSTRSHKTLFRKPLDSGLVVSLEQKTVFLNGEEVGDLVEDNDDFVVLLANDSEADKLKNVRVTMSQRDSLTPEKALIFRSIAKELAHDVYRVHYVQVQQRAQFAPNVLEAWKPETGLVVEYHPRLKAMQSDIASKQPTLVERYHTYTDVFEKQTKTFVAACLVTVVSLTLSFITMAQQSWDKSTIAIEITKIGSILTTVIIGFLDLFGAVWNWGALLADIVSLVTKMRFHEREVMVAVRALDVFRGLDQTRLRAVYDEWKAARPPPQPFKDELLMAGARAGCCRTAPDPVSSAFLDD